MPLKLFLALIYKQLWLCNKFCCNKISVCIMSSSSFLINIQSFYYFNVGMLILYFIPCWKTQSVVNLSVNKINFTVFVSIQLACMTVDDYQIAFKRIIIWHTYTRSRIISVIKIIKCMQHEIMHVMYIFLYLILKLWFDTFIWGHLTRTRSNKWRI